MKFFESFLLALSNILSSKMRSFLTMLGIIIGIAAVMVIVGMGNGMENYITSAFESIGTKTMTVTFTGSGSSRTVSDDDMYEIVRDNAYCLEHVSPTVSAFGTVKIGNETFTKTSAKGVGEEYFEIYDYTVAKGRDFRYLDMDKRETVCVVGSYVDEALFGGNSIGKTLRLGGTPFTVVGVLDDIDDEPEEGGSDDAVFVPYSTAARLNYTGTASSYVVSATTEELVDTAEYVLENELYERFKSTDSYIVVTMSSVLGIMTDMVNVVVTVLAVIAAISLVVGGIGIMNIMLVSVSERTREIGIRKALGAKERYILSQFVIEAALTSAIGGVIGIACGFGLSSVATKVIMDILGEELVVTPSVASIIVAFGASAAIGIVFGYLPAKKAARLNPIDALRYE